MREGTHSKNVVPGLLRVRISFQRFLLGPAQYRYAPHLPLRHARAGEAALGWGLASW